MSLLALLTSVCMHSFVLHHSDGDATTGAPLRLPINIRCRRCTRRRLARRRIGSRCPRSTQALRRPIRRPCHRRRRRHHRCRRCRARRRSRSHRRRRRRTRRCQRAARRPVRRRSHRTARCRLARRRRPPRTRRRRRRCTRRHRLRAATQRRRAPLVLGCLLSFTVDSSVAQSRLRPARRRRPQSIWQRVGLGELVHLKLVLSRRSDWEKGNWY